MKRFLLALALMCALATATHAQTSVTPFITPEVQFFDSNGVPLAGGLLYSYNAGTTTPLATYTDASGSTQNTNPVLLDAAGRAQVWLSPQSYKFVLKDNLGNQLWSADNIPGAGSVTLVVFPEATCSAGSVSTDVLCGSSLTHRLTVSNNGAAPDPIVGQNTIDILSNKTLVNPIVIGSVSGSAIYASPSLTNPTINGATINGTIGGTATYASPSLTTPTIVSPGILNPTISGVISGNPAHQGSEVFQAGLVINTSVFSGTGLQHQMFGGTCTTGAFAGAMCSQTYTWAVPFPDAAYTVSCTGGGVTGTPSGPYIENITATGFDEQLFTFTNTASSLTRLDCVGMHN